MKYLFLIILGIFLVGCSSDCYDEDQQISMLANALSAKMDAKCPTCQVCEVCKAVTVSDCQPYINAVNRTIIYNSTIDTNVACSSYIRQVSRLEDDLEDCYLYNNTDCDDCQDDLDECEEMLEDIRELI